MSVCVCLHRGDVIFTLSSTNSRQVLRKVRAKRRIKQSTDRPLDDKVFLILSKKGSPGKNSLKGNIFTNNNLMDHMDQNTTCSQNMSFTAIGHQHKSMIDLFKHY